MATEYNEAECRALDRKFEHPEEVVTCPRCGGQLEYQSKNGSCTVKCETSGCIRDAIRGI